MVIYTLKHAPRTSGHGGAQGWLRGLTLLVVMLMALPLAACAGGASKADLAEVTEAYRAGRYSEAYAKAEDLSKRSAGLDKDRAGLIAGQAAHAMSNKANAERWLRPLTNSADREINGNANATLGLLAFNERRYAAASVMLSAAAGRLTGDDGARAALYAGDSYEQLAQPVQARSSFQKALAMAQDVALRRTIQDRLVQGPYTIQLGAFQTRDRATQIARQNQSTAQRAGLPTPVVVTATGGPGSQLFAVQVGTFTTRPAAEAAKARSGLQGVVISVGKN